MSVRTRLALLATVAVAAAALALPGAAQAETYSVANSGCWGKNGGQSDATGRFFMVCTLATGGNEVRILSATRTLLQRIPLGYRSYDVAPAPDGNSFYVTRPDAVDDPSFPADTVGWNRPARYVRSGTSFVRDTAWRLRPFSLDGRQYLVQTRYLSTDGAGNIYATSGGWSEPQYADQSVSPTRVLKYTAGGSYVTGFGDWSNTWSLGLFYHQLNGIAVTRDGSRLYTVENGNNRVQSFARTATGSYSSDGRSWGALENHDRNGSCANGYLAAPYDVGLDAAGFVYVMNTTCRDVQKFTRDGVFISRTDMALYRDGVRLDWGYRQHGFAVDAAGNVYTGETGKVMLRSGAVLLNPSSPAVNPNPAPVDSAAPTLKSVTLPATTTSRTITVATIATDDAKVVSMRLANEDGNWGSWLAYAPSVQHQLTAGAMTKGVSVQVRDAGGRESNIIYTMLSCLAPCA